MATQAALVASRASRLHNAARVSQAGYTLYDATRAAQNEMSLAIAGFELEALKKRLAHELRINREKARLMRQYEQDAEHWHQAHQRAHERCVSLASTIRALETILKQTRHSWAASESELARLREQLRQSVALPLSLGSAQTTPQHETGEARYKEYVRRIRQYILDGDCMQVVPSQRMSLPFADKPLSLYRALRTLNPSPYLFYYDFGDFHIVGSSPEILVRRERNQITVRPIAGTRLRGKTPEEDVAQAESLLADAKEIAEHVMLIDLGRNDVGRISQTGSVKVTDKMVIERYSHVMHIVSNVEGELKPGIGNMDILAATFPAGTLSGAPKVRALEIIEELEPAKRCIYGGAVGNWSFNNDMDLAIAIRTAVIKNGTLYVQSGGGIVADSDEEAEWQETQNKARAVLRAAEMVQQGLDG